MKVSIDKIGIFASGLCLIHCIATPILLTVFPLMHVLYDGEEHFHILAILFLLPVTALALFPKNKTRKFWKQKSCLMITGVALLILGLYFEGEETKHDILSMSGSLFLIIGHLVGLKESHSCH